MIAVKTTHMKRLLFAIIAFCGSVFAQTPYAFMPAPRFQFFNGVGAPDSGGFLYTWAAGTSTPLATYHLDTLGNITANQNPVPLDAIGSAEVRLLPQCYKMQLQDSTGAQVWMIDQICDVGQLLLTEAVLLNPAGGASQTIAGPLAFTTLSLNSGTPLTTTNQSGTGILCMTISCVLATPSINGITIPGDPATLISIPNASTGTAVNTLTKLTASTASWTKRNDQSGSGTGSPQTATVFSVPLTNPSLIVVLTQGLIGTFSVTDSAGNAYSDCGAGQITFNASANGLQCFYAVNTSTTTGNIVSFASTGGGAMTLTAMEWTGVALVNPVDLTQNSGSNQSTGTGGGQNVSSGSATTTAADLVLGFAGVGTGTLSVGIGFNSSSSASLEYQVQTGPGATGATWNDNTNNDSYAAIMVAFRPYPGATALATQAATTDLSGIEGITVSGAGTSGSAVIQQNGIAPCVFDGATSANDYVQISSTVAGDCHDTGASTLPTMGGQVIGTVLSTNSGAGTYQIALSGPGQGSANSSAGTVKTICSNISQFGVIVGANTTSPQVLYACQLNNGALNSVGKAFRLTVQSLITPGGTATSNVGIGIGTTAALTTSGGVLGIASQGSSSSAWSVAAQLTCGVASSGTSGLIQCANIPSVSGGSATAGATRLDVISVNLTGPLFIGVSCSFGTASTSNTCRGILFTLEQLN